MTEKPTTYDPAEDLTSDAAIATFMAEAFETNDAAYIAHAQSVVARAKGMIDPSEHARRQAAIDFARGSVRYEGFILSPEVEDINRRFIDGELTGDEHIEAIKALVLGRG